MPMVTGSRRRRLAGRAGVYVLLVTIGAVMLFPFLFVLGSSLKSRTDIFDYPPRVLPYEQDDLSGSRPGELARMQETLDGLVKQATGERIRAHEAELTPQMREQLRALGYID